MGIGTAAPISTIGKKLMELPSHQVDFGLNSGNDKRPNLSKPLCRLPAVGQASRCRLLLASGRETGFGGLG